MIPPMFYSRYNNEFFNNSFPQFSFLFLFFQGSKLFNYLGFYTTADLTFVCFILTWVITRLYIFPVKIIASVIKLCSEEKERYQSTMADMMISSLILLFILHLVWTYMIVKAAKRIFWDKTRVDEQDREKSDNLKTTERRLLEDTTTTASHEKFA